MEEKKKAKTKIKTRLEKEYTNNYFCFQDNLMKLILNVIGMVLAIEILFLFMYIKDEILDISIFKYIVLYIIRPSSINLVAFFVGKYIIKKFKKLKEEIILVIPLIILIIVENNIVCVHYALSPLFAIYMGPILVSSIYGNKKIEKIVFYISCVAFSIATTFMHFDTYSIKTKNHMYNIIVTYVVMFFTHIVSQMVIDFENKRNLFTYKSIN